MEKIEEKSFTSKTNKNFKEKSLHPKFKKKLGEKDL